MPSFFETLRRPKALSAWADDGRIRAGESDPYAFAKDFLMRNSREEMNNRGYVGLGGNIGRIARGQENTRPMNVVYNQAPEMADKQFKFMKDQAALAQKNLEADRSAKALSANDDYIDNRRGNEMKQRQFDTNTDLARKKLALELSDRDKLALDQNNAMARIAAQGANALSLADLNNARARELNKEDNDARILAAQISASKPTASNTTTPNETAKATENKLRALALNPEYKGVITQDEDGKISINPKADSDLRFKLSKELYNRPDDINLDGINSSALGASLGSAGASGNIAERGSPTAGFQKGTPVQNSIVMMVAPDGRRLKVPAEKVAELEKAGAKRIQ